MNTKKRSLAILLTVLALIGLFSLSAFATETQTSGDFSYVVLDDGTVKITKYNGNEAVVTVPSVIEKKAVTVIGAYAFNYQNNQVTSITIPGSVEILEKNAIYFCEKLETVTIEEGKLKEIPGIGILNCAALKTLNLPSNIELIGTLMGCEALETINVASENSFLKNIDGVIYSTDGKTLIKCPQGKKAKIFEVPAEVTTIKNNAFYGVRGIEKICIPLTVDVIEEFAFAYSSFVIDYPNTSIPEKFKPAFAGRTVYTKIVTPGAVSKPSCNAAVTTVTLSWKAVKNAHGYEVYKYNSSTKKYVPYKTLEGTSIKLTGLKAGTAYKYKVRAYAKSEKTLYGEFSPEVKVVTKPADITFFTATATKVTVNLTWNEAAGADGYRVYKYNSKTKKYEYFKSTTATTLKITDLKPGTAYKYKVRAYVKDTDTIYGAYSPVVKVTTKPADITSFTATATKTTVTLKWNKATGADGYRIYKYNSKTKKYEYFKTSTATSLKISDLKTGATYKFKVRAYVKDVDTIYGEYSSVVSVTTKLSDISKISAKSGKTYVKLTWSKVNGADGYRVYYKSGDTWKVVAKSVKDTAYTVKELKAGTKRTYAVRAYKKTSSDTLWSARKTVTVTTTKK